MKRLLGLTGLTFLSVLAVVFYIKSEILICILSAVAVVLVAIGIVLLMFKFCSKAIAINVILIGAFSVLACGCYGFYSACIYQPIIDEYADNYINIEGYVSREIERSDSSCVYTITTKKVNGADKSINLLLTSYKDLELSEFDYVNASLETYAASNNRLLSKGVFLTSYFNDNAMVEKTGETEFSVYSVAINVKHTLQGALNELLPEDCSQLCQAVFLGDKRTLSYNVKESFTKTGTSFFIVVSGMHLALVTAFLLWIVKRFTKNRVVICIFVIFAVSIFSAITGFTPSVVRAGVMLIITYCGTIIFRKSDAINSLGLSAFVLTLANPFAVGDIGLILSFVATFGIIVWSDKINNFIVIQLKIKRRITRTFVAMVSVSFSASVWTIPITILAFGNISPLTVLISTVVNPLVSALVVCTVACSVLYLCPIISFLAYPFALVCGLVGRLIMKIISFFADIPFASINTNKWYFYVWLAVSLVLVAVGYFVKPKRFYIKCAVSFSAVVLVLGWSLFTITDFNKVRLNVFGDGSGTLAYITNGDSATVISCGGIYGKSKTAIGDLKNQVSSIDNVILPNQTGRYAKLLPQILNEFDETNILVYDKKYTDTSYLDSYDGNVRNSFGSNVHFSMDINSFTRLDVYSNDETAYYYATIHNKSVLFLPNGADVSRIDKRLRSVDYLIADSTSNAMQQLDCKTIIYTGNRKSADQNALEKIADNVIYTENELTKITFDGG